MMSASTSPNNQVDYTQQQQLQNTTQILQQHQFHLGQTHQTNQQQHINIHQQAPLLTAFPPVETVEIPLRQHIRDTVPSDDGRGSAVILTDCGNSANGILEQRHNKILTGPAPHSQNGYGSEQVIRKQQKLYAGISSSSNDHKTQHSASSRSSGSGGNNLLQIAFPTAEFAIQQQLLLEQQQHAQMFAEQQQLCQNEQIRQPLPPLHVSVPSAPVATTTTRLAPLPSPMITAPLPSGIGGNSPWTLGSTDCTFALSMLLREMQEDEAAKQMLQMNISGDNPMNSNRITDNSVLPTEQAELYTNLYERLSNIHQQEIFPDITPPSAAGAAILADGHANTADISNISGRTYNVSNDPTNVIDSQNDKQQKINGSLDLDFSKWQQQPSNVIPVNASTSKYVEKNPLLRISGNSRTEAIALLRNQQSLFQQQLFLQDNVSSSVEACLAAACEVLKFDIAEMWLRTGPKTHQLTYSHLRPTALEDGDRRELVDVYYGEKSSERTHRLSPALCKRAKEAGDVVWVTAHNPTSAEALRCSISNVRTAVAVPVCHESSNTNMTILFFSIRRIIVRPTSVEFIVHMSLAAGVASVCSLSNPGEQSAVVEKRNLSPSTGRHNNMDASQPLPFRSEHVGTTRTVASRPQPMDSLSVTGARLDLQWRQLSNVEYLTDGGNSWIHTAVFQGRPVVVKTLKPECQDVAVAINEIEGELSIHSRLNHPNIVSLLGAGLTSKGVRFFVLERLDGGTLTQMLGYETRIRDRRRRFWRRKMFSFLDVLRIARSIAEAMEYCHEKAIPGSIVLHRDLKPDNIGFTLDGTVKLMDFGLAKILEIAGVDSDTVYAMSGETGSLRYMAPEVADGLPYNFTADVYSFGIILWELNSGKKPYEGLNRELFYERIVHGGERPSLSRKWPTELTTLMTECWDADMFHRPPFHKIVSRLDAILAKEKGVINIASGKSPSPSGIPPGTGADGKGKKFFPKLTGMIDRHSMWF